MIINNTERRAILRTLVDGEKSFEEIVNITHLSPDFVKTQLEFLEWGFCVERFMKDEKEYFRLTKEGEIIKKLPE
jgi:predicted transcriptional regulator